MKSIKAPVSRAALPLASLALPMVIESFFRILVSSADTIMLSFWSQESVAAVGLASQYIFFIQILFNVICVGTSIVLSQYLGAERHTESKQVAQASFGMVGLVAIVLSLAIVAGTRPLLSLYSIEDSVRLYATQYLLIFGGLGSLFTALNMLQVAILRSYGHTKDAMFISFIANIINVIGNALSLYGFFGLPVLGVVGVAFSSVFSQVCATIILGFRMRAHSDVYFDFKGFFHIPRSIYQKILSIGVPVAGENLAYNISQIVITAMITTLGTWAMSAHVYTQTIVRFVFVAASAIGSAVQIKVGYFVGAQQPEQAYKRVYRYQLAGTSFSIFMILLLNLVKAPIIGIFTQNSEIAALTYAILYVSIYVETGRSINLITIPALKGAGDVHFPVLVGILCMWGISVPLGWFLGLRLGLGLPGIWFAIGTDETIRGIIMLFRWKSKKWQSKAIT